MPNLEQLNANNLSAYIRKLSERLDSMEKLVQTIRSQGGGLVSLPGNYAGKAIPSMIGQEIVIPAGVTTQQFGTITIAAEGPFVACSLHFAYRPTAGANAGCWRPISEVNDYAMAGLAQDTIDFYWEYQVSGSLRNRQDIPVPSALLSRAEEGYGRWMFHVEDTFNPSATIRMGITPTRNPTNAGRIYFGFHGTYLLD